MLKKSKKNPKKKSIPKVKVKKIKLKSKKKVQKKSQKTSQKNQQSTKSQKKQVMQKLCIGKQVKEKLVTRQIAAFLLMAYGFQSIKILEPFWLFNFHLFQPQASPNPLPQSRRIPTQPQPLSQGLFSPKPAAAQILGQVAARARRWAGCGWLLAEGSG